MTPLSQFPGLDATGLRDAHGDRIADGRGSPVRFEAVDGRWGRGTVYLDLEDPETAERVQRWREASAGPQPTNSLR